MSSNVHTSLVIAKTKVAPIERQAIPRLELCGAYLLAQLLDHVKEVFHLSIQDIHAWTDSTIVLNWLSGIPRHFKTFVGNRVSSILELIPPGRWKHISGTDKPADSASRSLFPSGIVVERPHSGALRTGTSHCPTIFSLHNWPSSAYEHTRELGQTLYSAL